jgi:8-oxo-dGTP diphosphatase
MRRPSEQPDPEAEVLAAGGVVVRHDRGEPRVAAIHRPKYRDWSLPKGKLEPGEGFEQAAAREVEEETGLRGWLGPELSSARYLDRNGRPKLVRYWLIEPLEGEPLDRAFSRGREVDELRWVTEDEATALLDYEHDRRLVREALRAR